MSCHSDTGGARATRTARQGPASAGARVDMPPHRVRFYGRRDAGEPSPLVVHFHGGAFVSGSVDHPSLVAQMLADAGAVVISVDYPLAPGHPFPAALEAAYATLDWAHRHRGRLAGKGAGLFVAGEEAGGNIAACTALMARDRRGPPLEGQILFSPLLDASMGTASMRCAQGTPAGADWADGWKSYLSCPCDASHPYATPTAGSRFAGLPPLLLFSSPDDPLRDEGCAYAQRLKTAGVPVCREALAPASIWNGERAPAAGVAAPQLEAVRGRLFSFLVTHPAASAGGQPTAP
ncbi:alpha/beta hydrolase [Bordetella genomosp. 9]|uniref:Alpha/beta hydrolase fold-3 domain-containing protein n=1 Tax=Bordetella genomosp. 9 TaxID=1416803 RepID=A0A1W6YW37_9BORD|nr:alpha/beta hydrolase [Bordetella genomosp. 9]ARP84803.1 hypothetical protein CAL13_00100 [Bordetella genomosp. 9]ARP92391.1 hypothetical protein CAL14_00100 [Bordetella genomosp. 9]